MGAGFVPAPPRRRPLVRALCEQRRRQLEEAAAAAKAEVHVVARCLGPATLC